MRQCFAEENLHGSSSSIQETAVANDYQNGQWITEEVDYP